MALSIDYQQFMVVLNEELQHINTLQELLAAEKSALEQADSAAIEKITQNKITSFYAIEESEKKRQQLLSDCNVQTDKDGMKQLILHSPNSIQFKLKAVWQKILQQLEICKQLNITNGIIINTDQKRVNHLLSIIFGNNDVKLYGAKAQTYSTRSNQKIDKA